MLRKWMSLVVIVCAASLFISGCSSRISIMSGEGVRTERTAASYMSEGRAWGKRLLDRKVRPGDKDEELINTLIGRNLDYFYVHEDLKEAFRRGFRMGYEDRVADLVLGPQVTEAAGRIGDTKGKDFVGVVNGFEDGWRQTLDDAVRVFIVLVAEGSQADREIFTQKFSNVYTEKYQRTQKIKTSGGVIPFTSEGGTRLFLDIKTTSAFLDIPSPGSLKAEIYRQAFRAMGDEWGKRLSTNLIKRSDLIDLLRRTKVALKEEGTFSENLEIIQQSFGNSYGTDAPEVFASLIKEAGYDTASFSLKNRSKL